MPDGLSNEKFVAAVRYVVALSSLTLEDIDSVSEIHSRRDPMPRFPLPSSSWINQYNSNPYGPSPSSLLSGLSEQKDSVYAPPPPYNIVVGTKAAASYISSGRTKETGIGSGSGIWSLSTVFWNIHVY